MRKPNRIIGVFTGLLGPGGVQRLGRHMAAALVSFANERAIEYRLFGLNDPPRLHQCRVGEENFAFQGFGREKASIVLTLAKHSLSRRSFLYLNHPHLAPMGWFLSRIRPGTHYAVHAHGIEVWKPLTFIQQVALRRAAIVTASSRFTAERLREVQRRVPTRIEPLYPALDPEFQSVAAAVAKNETPGGPTVLTVSRLAAHDREKGIDTVLRAMPRIREAQPGVRYILVGTGSDLPRLKQIASEAGVSDLVEFHGPARDIELMQLYATADLFVMPSAKEGFGIVFLEAMAHGKAVVGGNTGGTPEVVVHGETGLLVGYDDVEGVARSVIELLSNPEKRAAMGAAGRKRLEGGFRFEHFRRRFSELMSQALGEER